MTEYTPIAPPDKGSEPVRFFGFCPDRAKCDAHCKEWWPGLQCSSEVDFSPSEAMWLDPYVNAVTPPPKESPPNYLAPEAIPAAQHFAAGGIVQVLNCDNRCHPIIEEIERWGMPLVEATRFCGPCQHRTASVSMFRLRHPSSPHDPIWWAN